MKALPALHLFFLPLHFLFYTTNIYSTLPALFSLTLSTSSLNEILGEAVHVFENSLLNLQHFFGAFVSRLGSERVAFVLLVLSIHIRDVKTTHLLKSQLLSMLDSTVNKTNKLGV